MRVYRDLDRLPEFRNAVITIGSFDGIHRGHQTILRQMQDLAREVDGESVLITFDPHPRQVVYPRDQSLQLLCTLEEKIRLLERYRLDNLVVVPFTVEFSQMGADEYIEKFLIGKFRPRCVVIGYDHRFGSGRQGDVNYLNWYAEKHDFRVVVIDQQRMEDIAISSTKIRQALEAGNIRKANQLLGHYFPLSGKVVHGQQLGKKLGFPTANLQLSGKWKLVPPNAIYAIWAFHHGLRYGGMLYIGDRPTLRDHNERTIEAHLFDFEQDIYGEELYLEIVDLLRWDIQFEDLAELQRQLLTDEGSARAVLAESKEKKSPARIPPPQ